MINLDNERQVIYWQGFLDRENHYDCSPSFLSIKDLKNKSLKNDISNIYQFANNFLDHLPLCGTNKQSFENSSNEFSFWHYHIGDPYNDSFSFYHSKKCYKNFEVNTKNSCKKCKTLENKIGIESKKVIYYVKFSENIIGIVGYGLEHIPFPKLNDKAVYSVMKAKYEHFK